MRTRESNKNKHFHQFLPSAAPEDDLPEGRKTGERGGKRAAAEDSDLGQGSEHSEAEVEDEGDIDEDDEYEEGDEEQDVIVVRGKHAAKHVEKSPAQSRTARRLPNTDDVHDLQSYPTDPKLSVRHYAGRLKNYFRFRQLYVTLYGPDPQHLNLVNDLNLRWLKYPVLPARFGPEHPAGVLPSPWLPPDFERDEQNRWLKWYENCQAEAPDLQQLQLLSPEDGRQFLLDGDGDLVAFLGPAEKQKPVVFEQGTRMTLAPSGLGIDDPDIKNRTPSGWMFDVRGIVLSMAWAPQVGSGPQILAVAAIPFSDQAYYETASEVPPETAKQTGSVQLWRFTSEEEDNGIRRPSKEPPLFAGAVCVGWGRIKRLQWCPIAPPWPDIYGLLAVLCGDGQVRVVELNSLPESDAPHFTWVESPIVTLGISTDYNVQATCLTWIGANRIALGHSDGTLTLWSLHPRRLLQRHAAHGSRVLEMCSAYPSHPYLVASVPVGGAVTLTDLARRPSAESTYVPVASIAFQPHVLAWSEHLQAFVAAWPSGGPANTSLALLQVRNFAVPRALFSADTQIMCVAVGAVHPFLLVGCADGALWASNPLARVLREKGQTSWKMKLLEHEFRPEASDEGERRGGGGGGDGAKDGGEATSPEAGAHNPVRDGSSAGRIRGAVRILQGFLPEENNHTRTEMLKSIQRKKRTGRYKTMTKKRTRKNKSPSGKRRRQSEGKKGKRGTKDAGDVLTDDDEAAAAAEGEDDQEGEDPDEALSGIKSLAKRLVIHEPLTRVSSVVWNPNVEFGWWAATAMGSGLVRVMDLGVE